ncbi:MAG TPA: hypothetical protein EYN70_06865, partial [Planctomycetaceae bacterium]|nr:hypothetical protein [Planctomycetaceae bacterium]
AKKQKLKKSLGYPSRRKNQTTKGRRNKPRRGRRGGKRKRASREADSQKSILVHVVEGESNNPEDCSSIGRCRIPDLPPDLPKNTAIEVRFRYRTNGRLTVMVSVAGSETELRHEFARDNSLTQDQLNLWREFVSGVAPAEV